MSENAPKTEKKISVLNKAVTKQGSNAKITAVIEHCRVWGRGGLTVFIFFDTFLRKFCSLGEKMIFQCGLFSGILLKPEKK